MAPFVCAADQKTGMKQEFSLRQQKSLNKINGTAKEADDNVNLFD